MLTTQLNPAQLNVLSLMSYISTEQEQQELQELLLEFYRKKTDALLLQFQQENGISQETLDEWADQHLRALVKVDHAFGQLRQMKEGKLQGVNADDLLNEL